MDLVKILSEQYMKPELPEMNVGDTVRVLVRVKEGNRERTQAFEGTIIAKKHGGINETITVSFTICATASARRQRSRSACNKVQGSWRLRFEDAIFHKRQKKGGVRFAIRRKRKKSAGACAAADAAFCRTALSGRPGVLDAK